MTNTDLLTAAHHALDCIDALDPRDPDCDDLLDTIRCIIADNTHDLLINFTAFDDDAPNPIPRNYNRAFDLMHDITAAMPHDIESLRHRLSMLALDLSLCPMHFIDYAICFDDEIDECALIRTYFPRHDT
jgi:hypothetical protein